MGRTPFLTTLAWGRSIWAAPGENEWNCDTQTSQPTRPSFNPAWGAVQHASQPLYDGNLRPVNPEAQRNARDRRRAANNILTIIGVVESTRGAVDTAKIAERNRREESWVAPVVFGANIVVMIFARWITNLSIRLQASSWLKEDSLVETIIQDCRLLGPAQFFFAGVSAVYPEIVIQPYVLTEEYCYWTLRAVCANISSLEIRQAITNATPWIERCYNIILEVMDYPVRLHMCLQQLGLIRSFAILPEGRLLVSIFDCIRSPGRRSLPLVVAFFHGLLARQFSAKYVWPRIERLLLRIYQSRGYAIDAAVLQQHGLETTAGNAVAMEERSADSAENNIGSSQQHALSAQDTFEQELSGNDRVEASTADPGVTLLFDDDQISIIGASQAEATLDSPVERSDAQSGSLARSQDEMSARDTSTQQAEDGPQLRIDIAARPGANGTVVEELNIHLADRDADVSTNALAMQQAQAAIPDTNEELYTFANVPLASMQMELLVQTSLVLLTPVDCLMLSGLATWWISTHGKSDHVGQQVLGRFPGAVTSVFTMTPSSLLWSSLKWGNKYLLCSAMKMAVMGGLWTARTEALIWLGRRYFEWPHPTKS